MGMWREWRRRRSSWTDGSTLIRSATRSWVRTTSRCMRSCWTRRNDRDTKSSWSLLKTSRLAPSYRLDWPIINSLYLKRLETLVRFVSLFGEMTGWSYMYFESRAISRLKNCMISALQILKFFPNWFQRSFCRKSNASESWNWNILGKVYQTSTTTRTARFLIANQITLILSLTQMNLKSYCYFLINFNTKFPFFSS